jgi:hypothetical protein
VEIVHFVAGLNIPVQKRDFAFAKLDIMTILRWQ